MTAKRRIFVSGWVGAANLGDELVFRSLKDKLQSRDVDVTVVSRDPEATRAVHHVDAVGWYDARGVLAGIKRSDALILGPGGLLQDETSIWNLPAHLHRVFLAKVARTPVLGLGLGVGPLHRASSRRIVRTALGSVPITVRDDASAELARQVGLKNVTTTADLAFGLPIPTAEPIDRIVASFRPFAGAGGIKTARRADLNSLEHGSPIVETAKALDELSWRTSLPVHLLALEVERDVPFHRQIAEAMSAPVTESKASLDTVFDEFARSRLVVAMRYHAVVAAIMATRPAVVVTYSPKVRSAGELMGSAAHLIANDHQAYARIADGARLLDREHDLALVRQERRTADQGNDQAIDSLLDSI